MSKKIKIVGAGLFGCAIAYELDRLGHHVVIIEQDSDIMLHASKQNHNRIHFGYHYPRSIETAEQSLDGLLSFIINYRDAIMSHFPNYYMVAKDSNVTASDYINFCKKVGISHTVGYPSSDIINKDLIDLSLKTDEVVYDYDILRDIVKQRIHDSNIKIKLNTAFDGNIDDCDYLINASYANINKVNKQLGVPELNIKLQDVVVPIFKMDHRPIGLTIMDGPYCSIMPKGKNDNEFLLYNVKHSLMKDGILDIDNIYRQSEKYMPFLKNVERIGYWRTKRALPINDNDERLSEVFTYDAHPKVINVLSGKISTCHKIGFEIGKMICE